MSSNYSAGQFDEPFLPKRLQNWNYESSWHFNRNRSSIGNRSIPGLHSDRRTSFVANDRGHLFPNIAKAKSMCSGSSWGDYATGVWDEHEHYPVSMMPKQSKPKPEVKKTPMLPRYYRQDGTEPPPSIPTKQQQQRLKRKPDRIIEVLRDAQAPIIWIVGLPTRNILHSRRHYAKLLADQLDFTYINLDEEILRWEQQRLENEELLSEEPPRPPAPTLTVEALEKLGEYEISQIKLPTTGKLSRDKLMELFKFAMIEAYPTNGYIIEGFPYDISDAVQFETLFYPVTLGIYFTESAVPSSILEIGSVTQFCSNQSNSPAKPVVPRRQIQQQCESLGTGVVNIHCINTSDDEQVKSTGVGARTRSIPAITRRAAVIVGPKFVKRNKPFSFMDAQKLCDLYASKIVRVINAENILMDTVGFINSIVSKYLKKHGLGIGRLRAYSSQEITSASADDMDLERGRIHCSGSVQKMKGQKKEVDKIGIMESHESLLKPILKKSVVEKSAIIPEEEIILAGEIGSAQLGMDIQLKERAVSNRMIVTGGKKTFSQKCLRLPGSRARAGDAGKDNAPDQKPCHSFVPLPSATVKSTRFSCISSSRQKFLEVGKAHPIIFKTISNPTKNLHSNKGSSTSSRSYRSSTSRSSNSSNSSPISCKDEVQELQSQGAQQQRFLNRYRDNDWFVSSSSENEKLVKRLENTNKFLAEGGDSLFGDSSFNASNDNWFGQSNLDTSLQEHIESDYDYEEFDQNQDWECAIPRTSNKPGSSTTTETLSSSSPLSCEEEKSRSRTCLQNQKATNLDFDGTGFDGDGSRHLDDEEDADGNKHNQIQLNPNIFQGISYSDPEISSPEFNRYY